MASLALHTDQLLRAQGRPSTSQRRVARIALGITQLFFGEGLVGHSVGPIEPLLQRELVARSAALGANIALCGRIQDPAGRC
jgi:hypothetical protein